jgi:hypothetical protein
MRDDEKRELKGYKVKPSVYRLAMKRAKKEKGHLANLIENVVLCYAYGLDVKATKYDKAGNEEIEKVMPETSWPNYISIK